MYKTVDFTMANNSNYDISRNWIWEFFIDYSVKTQNQVNYLKIGNNIISNKFIDFNRSIKKKKTYEWIIQSIWVS